MSFGYACPRVATMSGPALGLVLLAAISHATWNLLARRAREKLAFLWCSTLVRSHRSSCVPTSMCIVRLMLMSFGASHSGASLMGIGIFLPFSGRMFLQRTKEGDQPRQCRHSLQEDMTYLPLTCFRGRLVHP